MIDEKWGVFEQMIRMMTPWGMAEMMAGMIPDMIGAMPAPFRAVMKMSVKAPSALKPPVVFMMKGMMPSLFPMLLPGMMPKIMPAMLKKVGEKIAMPPYLAEQMPSLMPKTMEVLMPKMLPEIIPHFMPLMLNYIRSGGR